MAVGGADGTPVQDELREELSLRLARAVAELDESIEAVRAQHQTRAVVMVDERGMPILAPLLAARVQGLAAIASMTVGRGQG